MALLGLATLIPGVGGFVPRHHPMILLPFPTHTNIQSFMQRPHLAVNEWDVHPKVRQSPLLGLISPTQFDGLYHLRPLSNVDGL